MMHLSRLSEELILWSTTEWNFIKFSDSFSTGSSLMPQKKNPDPAELIRGKAGRVFGNYINLITVLKGLPLSYNRDLQEDKEPLFDSYTTYSECLEMMAQLISTIQINEKRFIKELQGDFSLATDLCDWLVLQGIPFRNSHEIVGKLVKYAEDSGKNFAQLRIEELKRVNPVFNEEALEILNSNEFVLYRKKTKGSPNPDFVKEELSKWKSILLQKQL
jgi:argininosuccinate lyase